MLQELTALPWFWCAFNALVVHIYRQDYAGTICLNSGSAQPSATHFLILDCPWNFGIYHKYLWLRHSEFHWAHTLLQLSEYTQGLKAEERILCSSWAGNSHLNFFNTKQVEQRYLIKLSCLFQIPSSSDGIMHSWVSLNWPFKRSHIALLAEQQALEEALCVYLWALWFQQCVGNPYIGQ